MNRNDNDSIWNILTWLGCAIIALSAISLAYAAYHINDEPPAPKEISLIEFTDEQLQQIAAQRQAECLRDSGNWNGYQCHFNAPNNDDSEFLIYANRYAKLKEIELREVQK